MVVDEVIDLGVSRQLGKDILGRDGSREQPTLELLEKGGSGELALGAHGEPVCQEHVEAASCNATGRLFHAPFVLVEGRPVRFVESVDVRAVTFGVAEQQVLDQIRVLQRCTTAVQRLEDDLRVVVFFQVDDDQTQLFPQRLNQHPESLLRLSGIRQPPVDLLLKVSDGFGESPCPSLAEHDGAELVTVRVGRPDLVEVVGVLVAVEQVLVVLQELTQQSYGALVVEGRRRQASREQEQLQRCQTLLAVDDLPCLQA
ncbi:hypothetical protein STANM309S_00596 [Streptomyces tanashiensis]